jgi:C terminal of Calcineurin-like phosphoesterase/N terminal of Calcineurin-like phosphoesterase
MTSNADLSRRDLMAAAAALAAALPVGTVRAEEQAAPLAKSHADPKIVRGTVFESRSGERARQAGDPGIKGVLVSNGREAVRTDSDGRYSLPIEDGMAVFVIKPSDTTVPLDTETNLPRFSFVHQPEGTPPGLDLLYPGLAPTGPLPESVDFALVRSKEPRRFDAVLFTDPQPESHAEIDFIRDDVVAGLNGVEAAFGITAGDIMFDELSLYQRYNAIVGQIGLPWWNIGGNHDLNFEAPNARYCRETYKRVFGATYYAFEYGDVLFLMLDNVDYLGADPANPRRSGKYRGLFGERQLEFVANVLKETPPDRLVAAFMHIPLQNYLSPNEPSMSVADRDKFLALLEGRKTVSFSGHTHTTEHHYFGATEGFMGSVPHHHHVLTAVSGSWWSGPLDRRGIASADSRDGTPHGFHILSIDSGAYTTHFVPANEPNGRQMRISLDANPHFGTDVFRDFRAGQLRGSPLRKDELASVNLVVNVFDGGPKTTVAYRIGASAPVPMKREARPDPFVLEVFGRNRETIKPWVKAEPSSHIWIGRLPASLEAGAHAIDVHVVDEYGRAHRDGIVLEVTG